LSSYNVSTP